MICSCSLCIHWLICCVFDPVCKNYSEFAIFSLVLKVLQYEDFFSLPVQAVWFHLQIWSSLLKFRASATYPHFIFSIWEPQSSVLPRFLLFNKVVNFSWVFSSKKVAIFSTQNCNSGDVRYTSYFQRLISWAADFNPAIWWHPYKPANYQ